MRTGRGALFVALAGLALVAASPPEASLLEVGPLQRMEGDGLPSATAATYSPAKKGGWRPPVRLIQGGRLTREDGKDIHNEMIVRAESDLCSSEPWIFLPFLEGRWDTEADTWSRLELGAEIGLKPIALCKGRCPRWLKPLEWLYLGSGFQQAWIDPGNDRPEWELRTAFDIPLPWKCAGRPLGLYALGEYTYELEEGSGARNEVGAGLRIPLPIAGASAAVGWRHVDLIHGTDEDQVEGSVIWEF